MVSELVANSVVHGGAPSARRQHRAHVRVADGRSASSAATRSRGFDVPAPRSGYGLKYVDELATTGECATAPPAAPGSRSPGTADQPEGERRDSNPRPPRPQRGALPTELRPPSDGVMLAADRVAQRTNSTRDRRGHCLDDLLFLVEPSSFAHWMRKAPVPMRVRADRQAADRVPAEPLDLERVHQHSDGRPLARRVVLVDRPADRPRGSWLRSSRSSILAADRRLARHEAPPAGFEPAT